jgi:UDP-glucose 4-epimerase
MILITGGLGFIGSHTVRALLDLGQSCILTQHRTARRPEFIARDIGGRALIEQVDVTDRQALLEIGKQHTITGIVHLAGVAFSPDGPIDELRANTQGLLNVLEAAQQWGVPRVGVASTIGVYMGTQATQFREDLPLPVVAMHAIPVFKRSAELFAMLVGDHVGFEIANFRIGAIWGPLGAPRSPFFATPQLVHAAVRGEPADPTVYAGDGGDMCYVKDCGRAIALLQTAEKLSYQAYNISAGHPTTNAQVAAAINAVIPEAVIDLPDGRNPDGPSEHVYLDISRLREDTGFGPAYGIERAVADYIDWLRAGHDR